MLRQVAPHLLIGGALGALVGLCLLQGNYQGIADAVAGNDAPEIMQVIFVAGLSAQFGFSAGITGFLLMLGDD